MKKRAFFHSLAGIITLISVFMLTCSNPNGPGGGGCTKPNTPTNVKAETLSTRSIRVTWTPVGDAIFYNVYRTKTVDDEYALVGKALDASFTDTALASGTAHYYRISAKNDCDESAKSTPAFATTLSCEKPAAPFNVKAEAMSATSIKVSWDAIPTATGYKIYSARNADGTYTFIDSTKNGTYTNEKLQVSSTHYYKIIAKNDCGESDFSTYASATTNACPKPAAPTNVKAEAASSSSIEVTWDEVATALTYKIYRSNESAGTYSPVGNTAGKSSTSWTDEGLELAKTYYYKVVAESECEESAKSNYGFATTANCENKPAVPTNIRAEALSSTEVKVSWDAVSGAKTYSIYEKPDYYNEYYSIVTRATGTSYTVTSRHPSTIYHFKVSAKNDCGESEMSATQATVTTLDCDLPILPAPTGVNAIALSARSVSITWSPVEGAVYDIYRSTKATSDFWSVSGARDLTGTSFIDSTVSSSTTYYYHVAALNECGKSTNLTINDIVSVTTKCETPIPTNVTVTAKSTSSLEVSWNAISGAVSYSVYRATRSPTNQYTLIGKISGANSTYTDNGLENLTSYYYKITAKTEICDDSRMSDYASGTTQ